MNETFSDLDTIIQISKDPETEGFDLRSGRTWIYPTNYPVRDYQFNITQAALFQNTLVSLPTGLGKTFIAAVVMYNFYRWYPMGKIIFMAPTKPLVKQQMDACYNIMSIPTKDTAEMTGTKICSSRINVWRTKRVFFITPHILQNDIDTVLELASQVRCVVIDEAHKALGKNANCEAIKKLQKANAHFRILALSATPGSNFASVRDVIVNLLISHIEWRTSESIDVMPYVFRRKLDTIVVPLSGKLQEVKNKYVMILDHYTRPLLQNNILTGNCANLTKGRVVLTMKEFKERGRHFQNYTHLLRSLNVCVTLYHAYELLIRHGLRAFGTFLESSTNAMVGSIDQLKPILQDITNFLGEIPEIEMLPDGTIPEVTQDLVISHPKFDKLLEILLDHFKTTGADTKVMVFCEYRESVREIYSLLLRHRPMVKPRVFLGQGAITQAQQAQVIKSFKSGLCNTLVSTCIGEEGLDVGEVDLIICFDINTKSPIRMVQRMGRTGRKRDGRVVILVTEGKEQQMLEESMKQKDNMTNLLDSLAIKNALYKGNPRMVPPDIKPECTKMFITVEAEKTKKKSKDNSETKSKKEKKESKSKKDKANTDKNNTLRSMFDKIATSETVKIDSEESSNSAFSKNTFHEMKSPVKETSTKNKNKTKVGFKQGDLRNMFSKIGSSQLSQQSADVFSEKYITRPNISVQQQSSLTLAISKYLDKTLEENSCKICTNFFDCKLQDYDPRTSCETEWKQPELSLLTKISASSLQIFCESFTTLCDLQNESEKINSNFFDETTNSMLKNNESLEYFKLTTLSEIYSDDSYIYNPCLENAGIFSRSLGDFDDSVLKDMSRGTEVLDCQNKNVIVSDEEIICSDTDTSPVHCNKWFQKKFDNKVKKSRVLFPQQSSTPNFEVKGKVEALKKLESSCFKNSPNKKNSDIYQENKVSFVKENQKLIHENRTTPVSHGLKDKLKISPKQNNGENNVLKSEINNSSIIKNNTTEQKNISFEFWDESLFISSDFEDDCDKSNEKNSNQKDAQIACDKKQDLPVCNNINENPKNVESDSDATIEFAFGSDDDFDFQISKLEGVENQEISKKRNCSVESVLTVTQAVEWINKSGDVNKTAEQQNEEKSKSGDTTEELSIEFCFDSDDDFECVKNKSDSFQIKDKQVEFSKTKDNVTRSIVNEEINKENKCVESKIVAKQSTTDNSDIKVISKSSNKDKFKLSLAQKTNIRLNNKETNKTTMESPKILRNRSTQATMRTQEKPTEERRISSTQVDPDAEIDLLNDCVFLESDDDESLLFSQNTTKHKKMKLFSSQKETKSDNLEVPTLNEFVSVSQDSPLKVMKRKVSKKPVLLSDSDDDFEEPKWAKPTNVVRVTPNKKKYVLGSAASTKESEKIDDKPKQTKLGSNVRKKPKLSEYIDYEAEVEIDENYVSDSEEENDDLLQSSFVNDSESVLDQTDMYAKYLQTSKSPHFKRGAFKIPERLPPVHQNIFSQIDPTQDNTYQLDTFVVDNNVLETQSEELSYLEMMEQKLEAMKKKSNKRKRMLKYSD